MRRSIGIVIYRKLAAYPCPKSTGNRTVMNTTIAIIKQKAIIRYLNFNENTPIIRNDKVKNILRQRMCGI